MLQLTKKEKELLCVFFEKYDVKLRIYYFKNKTKVFIKKNGLFQKIEFYDNVFSFIMLLERIEKYLINEK